MKKINFDDLHVGDIIKHKGRERTFVVTSHHGQRVTAIATADITNLEEWEIVLKASYEYAKNKTEN